MEIGALFLILVSIIAFILAVIIYLLPGVIAYHRNHPNRLLILLLTIFLGGTGLVWIICLIWALTTPTPATMRD